MLEHITPLILTYDEAPNIGRTLSALTWATEVVIVDSFSTDQTLAIAGGFPNVRVVQRAFDSHRAQWSFGLLETGIATRWVLALDADWVLEPDLREEIARLDESACDGYWIPFQYRLLGRELGRTLYPPVLCLYRREGASYIQEGHAQRVRVPGRSARLQAHLTHDDRKPLSRWLWSQQRYAALEARWLRSESPAALSLSHRLRRKTVIMPWLAPLVYLFARGGIWRGRGGWAYALQRMLAESLIALYLLWGDDTHDADGAPEDRA